MSDEHKDTPVTITMTLEQAEWLAKEFDASFARYIDGDYQHPHAMTMYEAISEAIHTGIDEVAS